MQSLSFADPLFPKECIRAAIAKLNTCIATKQNGSMNAPGAAKRRKAVAPEIIEIITLITNSECVVLWNQSLMRQ